MNIGLTFILREKMQEKLRYLSEFDSIKDIERLMTAIQNGGWNVVNLEFGKEFVKRILEHRVDIVFNYAEGIAGSSRESQVPSILEMLQIPIVGSSAFCLMLTQNKHLCNLFCRKKGLPVPKSTWINDLPVDMGITKDLDFPLIVKPCREGSSYGISQESIVKNFEELENRVKLILNEFRQSILIENYIKGREICAGIIGNDPPKVLPLIETSFENEHEILTYRMKMKKIGYSHKKADISKNLERKIKYYSLLAFKELYCVDYARIDLRVGYDGEPYIIDVNPTPSLKEHSSFPSCAYLAGYSYDDLIEVIINESLVRNSLV